MENQLRAKGTDLLFWEDVQSGIGSLFRPEKPRIEEIRKICGADAHYGSDIATSAAVVWSLDENRVVESNVHRAEVQFPYVPGLLYLREAPGIYLAIRGLKSEFDLLMVDGHGLAHPRRAGLAVVLGVVLDRVTVGVAKSLLIGQVGEYKGRYAPIVYQGDLLGLAVREGGSEYYLSPGNRIRVEDLVALVEHLGPPYPKVLLEADRLSKKVEAGSTRRRTG